MNRGDVVLAAGRGDYGKARPWIVVQSDPVAATHPSITLCPVTTVDREDPNFRVPLEPSTTNGLREKSLIMVDKIQTLRREHVKARIGSIDAGTTREVDTALRVWLGLA